MIPNVKSANAQFAIADRPTRTYRLDLDHNRIRGFTDGLEAMEQAIYKILNTQRYEYLIYSWNYGNELYKTLGQNIPYVYDDIQMFITEALMPDDRILSIDAFSFTHIKRGVVQVRCNVHTKFGDVEISKEVRIGV